MCVLVVVAVAAWLICVLYVLYVVVVPVVVVAAAVEFCTRRPLLCRFDFLLWLCRYFVSLLLYFILNIYSTREQQQVGGKTGTVNTIRKSTG